MSFCHCMFAHIHLVSVKCIAAQCVRTHHHALVKPVHACHCNVLLQPGVYFDVEIDMLVTPDVIDIFCVQMSIYILLLHS